MANKKVDDKPIKFSKKVIDKAQTLIDSTKSSKIELYGTDPSKVTVLQDDVVRTIDRDLIRIDLNKTLKNNIVDKNMVRMKMNNKNAIKSDNSSVFDMIKGDTSLMTDMQKTLTGRNDHLKQLMQDYEIIKRTVPTVYKALKLIDFNISNPDGMTKDILQIDYGSIDAMDRIKIDDVLSKHTLNKHLKRIISDYNVISMAYILVTPYSSIVNMLRNDDGTMNESACDNIKSQYVDIRPLSEACNSVHMHTVINESVITEIDRKLTPKLDDSSNHMISDAELDSISSILAESATRDIVFMNGAMSQLYDNIYNETVGISSNKTKSMSDLFKVNNKTKSDLKTNINPDGFMDEKELSKIEKNVNFKGCNTTFLDPSRLAKFAINDTVIAYFYVADDDSIYGKDKNISNIMDQINSTIYKKMKDSSTTRKSELENMIIQKVGDNIINALSDKFIMDNMKEMNVIYEFVKEHELHTKKRRVVCYSPDDIVEVRREEGSILKNCVSDVKMYILTILTNTIINATRGGSRTTYYVQTGLTTDIEGQVQSAINSLKNNQIRYSDMGTIHEVFNLPGASTDVFLPQSIDGNTPLSAEVTNGQDVDMNTDFLQFLLRNIITSLNLPPVIVDNLDDLEVARTVSMVNLDVANSTLDAQLELSDPVNKFVKKIVEYNFPDNPEFVDEIQVSFNPPSVIVREMNRDIISNVTDMADLICELLVAEEDETDVARTKRLLKYRYMRACTPTLDWERIDEILANLGYDTVEDKIMTEITKLSKPNVSDPNGY